MKRLTMRLTLVMTTLLMGFGTAAQAAGTSAAQFLKMGAGARAAAMGGAFSAVADDVTAGYLNPAGFSQLSAPEISVMHNEGLVNTNYQYLAAAMPYNNSTFGFS